MLVQGGVHKVMIINNLSELCAFLQANREKHSDFLEMLHGSELHQIYECIYLKEQVDHIRLYPEQHEPKTIFFGNLVKKGKSYTITVPTCLYDTTTEDIIPFEIDVEQEENTHDPTKL
jgi:hypothetical protein